MCKTHTIASTSLSLSFFLTPLPPPLPLPHTFSAISTYDEKKRNWMDGEREKDGDIEKVRVTYYYHVDYGADGVDPLDGCLMKDA